MRARRSATGERTSARMQGIVNLEAEVIRRTRAHFDSPSPSPSPKPAPATTEDMQDASATAISSPCKRSDVLDNALCAGDDDDDVDDVSDTREEEEEAVVSMSPTLDLLRTTPAHRALADPLPQPLQDGILSILRYYSHLHNGNTIIIPAAVNESVARIGAYVAKMDVETHVFLLFAYEDQGLEWYSLLHRYPHRRYQFVHPETASDLFLRDKDGALYHRYRLTVSAFITAIDQKLSTTSIAPSSKSLRSSSLDTEARATLMDDLLKERVNTLSVPALSANTYVFMIGLIRAVITSVISVKKGVVGVQVFDFTRHLVWSRLVSERCQRASPKSNGSGGRRGAVTRESGVAAVAKELLLIYRDLYPRNYASWAALSQKQQIPPISIPAPLPLTDNKEDIVVSRSPSSIVLLPSMPFSPLSPVISEEVVSVIALIVSTIEKEKEMVPDVDTVVVLDACPVLATDPPVSMEVDGEELSPSKMDVEQEEEPGASPVETMEVDGAVAPSVVQEASVSVARDTECILFAGGETLASALRAGDAANAAPQPTLDVTKILRLSATSAPRSPVASSSLPRTVVLAAVIQEPSLPLSPASPPTVESSSVEEVSVNHSQDLDVSVTTPPTASTSSSSSSSATESVESEDPPISLNSGTSSDDTASSPISASSIVSPISATSPTSSDVIVEEPQNDVSVSAESVVWEAEVVQEEKTPSAVSSNVHRKPSPLRVEVDLEEEEEEDEKPMPVSNTRERTTCAEKRPASNIVQPSLPSLSLLPAPSSQRESMVISRGRAKRQRHEPEEEEEQKEEVQTLHQQRQLAVRSAVDKKGVRKPRTPKKKRKKAEPW